VAGHDGKDMPDRDNSFSRLTRILVPVGLVHVITYKPRLSRHGENALALRMATMTGDSTRR